MLLQNCLTSKVLFTLLICLSGLSDSEVALATSIVIIVTPKSVVLAADSKASFFDYETKKEEKKSVPKIYQSQEYFFAISGLTKNPKNGFDPAALINSILSQEANFALAIQIIKNKLQEALKRELLAQKANTLDALKRTIQESDIVISIGIVGLNFGKPFAHLLGFKVINLDSMELQILEDSCPGNCPNGVKVFWMGKADAISKYMSNGPVNEQPHLLAEKLIELECEASANYVGEPIDVIEISAENKKWHRQKIGCPIILR